MLLFHEHWLLVTTKGKPQPSTLSTGKTSNFLHHMKWNTFVSGIIMMLWYKTTTTTTTKVVYYWFVIYFIFLCGLHCRRKTSHFTSTRQVNLRARYPANSNDSTCIQSKITLKTLDGGFLKFNETFTTMVFVWFCVFCLWCLFSVTILVRWKIRWKENQVGFSHIIFLSPFSPWTTIPAILQTMKGCYLLTAVVICSTNYLSLTHSISQSTVILFLDVKMFVLGFLSFVRWFVLCCCFVLSL